MGLFFQGGGDVLFEHVVEGAAGEGLAGAEVLAGGELVVLDFGEEDLDGGGVVGGDGEADAGGDLAGGALGEGALGDSVDGFDSALGGGAVGDGEAHLGEGGKRGVVGGALVGFDVDCLGGGVDLLAEVGEVGAAGCC